MAEPVEPVEPVFAETDETGQTVRLSPVAGSEIAVQKVPGAVDIVDSADLARTAQPNITDALAQSVPGIVITDVQGNEFNRNIFYRGYESSPLIGVAQGLAVYQNGVRINEVYADTVNLDLIPSVAINNIAVVSNNPAFGLNALGGAISITMKDGFAWQGFETDFRAGSYGRIQNATQYGVQSGNWAAYGAFEGIEDDGWRDFSPTEIYRGYADLGWKGKDAEFHINYTAADTLIGATAATPIEAVRQRYGAVFTSPQITENNLNMLSVNGQVDVTKTMTLSGVAYYRHFKQKRDDGNLSDLVACDDDTDNPGGFCFDDDDNTTNIPGQFDEDVLYGALDRTGSDAESGGGSLQLVEKSKVFGMNNQLLIGASYDAGSVGTRASSEFGLVDDRFVVRGLGTITVDAEGNIMPVRLGINTDYYGLYLLDTLDVTDRLTVTAGGRYNYAELKVRDKTGNAPDLNSDSDFEKFNPIVGATYKLAPWMSVYGGYSESNRAPTPAELACADPEQPCLIESFLIADPPLKQVTAQTFEAGFRGEFANVWGGNIDWTVGLYRSESEDEILNVLAEQQGRGFFLNAGNALRQGVDLGLRYKSSRLQMFANYGFVDAVADSSYSLFSAANPRRTLVEGEEEEEEVEEVEEVEDGDGDEEEVEGEEEVELEVEEEEEAEGGVIFVRPGDRLPSIPRHNVRLGFDYWLTPKWKIGADLIVTSDRFFLGDESNLNQPLSGYELVNLRTSYDVTDHVQIYGLINNLFDRRHYLFGTYFNPDDVTNRSFSDPRSVVPGTPFVAYGGVKVKF